MHSVLYEIRAHPLQWLLLLFVPAVLAMHHLAPTAHIALFASSVLAIVPLAGLLR